VSLRNSLVWVICAVSLQFTLGFSLIVACGAVTLGLTLALPATILFLFAQNRLVSGLTGGAVREARRRQGYV
jgi:ABC-type maltose transport system permease subunit